MVYENPKAVNTNMPSWMTQNQNFTSALAFVILFLYASPIFLVAWSYWRSDQFSEGIFWFQWFLAFIKTGDSTLNLFHKILLPVLSALSIIALRGLKPVKVILLVAFILFSLCITIFVSVLFDMKGIQDALKGSYSNVDLPLAKAFFSRIQESLMMYLMILLGIKVSEKERRTPQ